MKLGKLFFLLGFLGSCTITFAQKSTTFNGKLYRIYPHTIDNYQSNVIFSLNSQKLVNLSLPPIIGQVEDGEYLIYNNNFVLKNKRKINKEIVYDTIYQVYATFTIKNNKKEGNAYIYTMYAQTVKCVIPYKNDLIDGHFYMYQDFRSKDYRHYYENDYYDNDYDDIESESSLDDYDHYIFYKNRVKFQGYKFELNYKEGLLEGQVKAFQYYKKDTLLVKQIEMVHGLKSGSFIRNVYWKNKGKIELYSTLSGMMENNFREGQWLSQYFKHQQKVITYYHAGILSAKAFYTKDTITFKGLFGRDSVIKHYPNYRSIATFPDVQVGRYNQVNSGSFVNFIYQSGKLVDYSIKIDGWINLNYNQSNGYTRLTDSIKNGRFIRTRKEGYSTVTISQYLLDTCGKLNNQNGSNNENGYCAQLLIQTTYNHKGKVTDQVKTSKYYELNPQDKSKEFVEAKELNKALISKRFYAPLDFEYSNIQWIKGRSLNASSTYQLSGDIKNGQIVKVLKIPMKYDTLYLNDTIMKNGKYLYKMDEYFKNGFESYLMGSYTSYNLFNDLIINYFKIQPIHHKSIYLGREAYVGQIEINIKYRKNPTSLKAALYEYLEFFGLQKRLEIVINLEQSKQILKANKAKAILPPSSITCDISEHFNGSIRYYDVFDNWSVSSSYFDNALNDDLEFKVNKITKRWNAKVKEKHTTITNHSMMYYENGLKEGQWFIEPVNYASTRNQYNFHHNKLNGMQYRFTESNSYQFLSYVYPMENDTIDGEFWRLRKNGYPIYHGYFEKGIPHGPFIKYFNTNERYLDTGKYFKEKYNFDHGYLSGRYEYYRDTNNLKYTIDFDKKDSMYFTAFSPVPKMNEIIRKKRATTATYDRHYYDEEAYSSSYSKTLNLSSNYNKVYNGSDFIDQIFESAYLKRGLYTYYYKSGLVFKQGYKVDNEPIGKWTFFRDGQSKIYKTIDFKDSFLTLLGKDSIFARGLVKAYYDDGKPMFVGYAIDEETKYTCESEAEIPTEEDYYLAFYDSTGRNVLEGGSSFITELQASGHKLKEGQIVDNKKQGIWIYYNNFGQAEAIGMYDKGLKVGRWLSGDLSGLNLSDKVCFMSNEEYFNWIYMYGGNLDLTETFYSNGVVINSNSVETIKR